MRSPSWTRVSAKSCRLRIVKLCSTATRRGSIELAARVDSNVLDGLVFAPFCFTEAAANLLTNPALDPFGKIPEFKYCAARVEAVSEGGDA